MGNRNRIEQNNVGKEVSEQIFLNIRYCSAAVQKIIKNPQFQAYF